MDVAQGRRSVTGGADGCWIWSDGWLISTQAGEKAHGLPERDDLNRQDLAWEGRMIAEAEAEADAGLLIPSAEVKA